MAAEGESRPSRVWNPAEILFLENLESGGGKRAGILIERGQQGGFVPLSGPLSKPAAKRRKLAVHVDDDTNAALPQQPPNSFYASIHIVQAMAEAYRVHPEDEVERSEQLVFVHTQPFRASIHNVFIARHRERAGCGQRRA